MILKVYLNEHAPEGALARLPLSEDQFLSYEEPWDEEAGLLCAYDLGPANDVSDAQAWFLDLCEWVEAYHTSEF